MNNKNKIYQERRQNGRFASFKAKCGRAFRFATRAALIGAAAVAIFAAGALTFSSNTVIAASNPIHADESVRVSIAPVLQRIADCESGNGSKGSARQFLNGQVLMVANTNKTVDVGMYQINSVWFKQASKLGYDLTTQEGNLAMAEWIYANEGTDAWASSGRCWKN